MTLSCFVAFVVVTFAPALAVAEDSQWGHLSGQFLYDGAPPTPETIPVQKDRESLNLLTVVDESLVVNKDTRGIADVLVYLVPNEGSTVLTHPSYDKSANLHFRSNAPK